MTIRRVVSSEFYKLLIVWMIVAVVTWGSPARPASKPAGKGEGVRVVGHLAGVGVRATSMTLRGRLGRRYLYVAEREGRGIAVVDVTRPAKANVVRELAGGGEGAARLESLGGALAVTGQEAGESREAGEGTRFLDLTDPGQPRELKELEGATAIARDTERGLVYVSNGTGIWIVEDDAMVDPGVKAWNEFASAP